MDLLHGREERGLFHRVEIHGKEIYPPPKKVNRRFFAVVGRFELEMPQRVKPRTFYSSSYGLKARTLQLTHYLFR